jgi:hypothetical protein
MTTCRDSLGSLSCVRDGGHSGPHRNGLVVWAQRVPEWLRRSKDLPYGLARDLTRNGGAA